MLPVAVNVMNFGKALLKKANYESPKLEELLKKYMQYPNYKPKKTKASLFFSCKFKKKDAFPPNRLQLVKTEY